MNSNAIANLFASQTIGVSSTLTIIVSVVLAFWWGWASPWSIG